MIRNKIRPKSDVASFVLEALKKQECIDHIFLVPGYVIDPFLTRYRAAGITPIVAAHEGGAAFMADGYGRASRNFGVCMGVGGPGVTNMLTAISAAYGDRSPVLILAGRIPADWEAMGTFQDSSSSNGIDDVAIMRPMTQFAASVSKASVINIFLRKAIRVLRDVESLPVFLSIPEDIQTQKSGASYIAPPRAPYRIFDQSKVKKIQELLAGNMRIAIFAGNGAVKSGASSDIKKFAEEYNIPVVTTMRAKGVISEDIKVSPMSFGVFGLGGSLQANKIVLGSEPSEKVQIEKAQLLLVLGATLNENNTFLHDKRFPSGKENLVIIDINPNSNRDAETDHTFVMGDAKTFLEWLSENSPKELADTINDRKLWTDQVRKNVPRYDTPEARVSKAKANGINPARAIADLRKVVPVNSILVVDSGAHTFFAGHHWESYGPNEFLMLSTTGPMGYGIAMGIGAWLAPYPPPPCAINEKDFDDSDHQDEHDDLRETKQQGKRPCICIVGDGSMLMHGMELHTAVRYRIPLVVVVINNGALGNVYLRFNQGDKREREAKKPGKELAEISPRVNWAEFAMALGAGGSLVRDPRDLQQEYKRALAFVQSNKKPYVVDVFCDRDCNAPNQPSPAEKKEPEEGESLQPLARHLQPEPRQAYGKPTIPYFDRRS